MAPVKSPPRSALLDTHTLLWACATPDKLSSPVRRWLDDGRNRALVSHATLWELSIKVGLAKVSLPDSFFEDIPGLGYEWLEIRTEHLAEYRKLPLHHRDPFDRMLVAQARHEHLPLISCDPDIRRYKVDVFW